METSDDDGMTGGGVQKLRAGPGSKFVDVGYGSNCRMASVGRLLKITFSEQQH